MKSKKTVLIMIMLLAISVFATGCMKAELKIKLNEDNSGAYITEVVMNETLIEEMFGSFDNESNSDDEQLITFDNELKEEIEAIEGLKLEFNPIEYEEDEIKFKGERATVSYTNINNLFSNEKLEEELSGLEIIDLGNGQKKIVMPFDEEKDEEETETEEDELVMEIDSSAFNSEFLNLIKLQGGNILFSIEIEHPVIEHNADNVEDNVYTWNILDRGINEEKEDMFLIYKER